LKVLVTGAAGFLGSRVVDALRARGHEVIALVRPASDAQGWDERVQVARGDLREPGAAAGALAGADAVIHLAAQVTGSDEARFAGTVVATEHLLASMAAAGVRRLVLASSFSVYDWSRAGSAIDERTPLEEEPALYERDGYAVAKWWQERVVRRAAEEHGLELTVLRPGFIWGPGNELVDGVGQRVGRVQIVFGPAGRLPLTHVENCADCFAAALDGSAVGATLNVVDGDSPSTWLYARDARAGTRVPLPFAAAFGLVRIVHRVARTLLGKRLRLPSIFVPRRFEARFKPVRAGGEEARRVLGWRPPLSYDEALRRTRG
jgi:nucleoside-diphosphate-sugar epimerase